MMKKGRKMTETEKELLYNALCCMVPYGTIAEIDYMLGDTRKHTKDIISPLWLFSLCRNEDVVIKPYLRKMSSMTEKEKKELCTIAYAPDEMKTLEEKMEVIKTNAKNASAFYNEYHFDYCGLIEKGLALEAPEGMY